MRKGDWLLIGVLLIIVSGMFFMRQTERDSHTAAAFAEITVDGKPYQKVALSGEEQDIEIRTNRGYNLLRMSEHGIAIIKADCPDQLCVGFGHKHESGDSIVCLPNRIFVEIISTSGEGGGIDAVVS